MANAGKLGWYLLRLAAMSPAEVAHRLIEQIKRRADRAKAWDWKAFGNFAGALSGLPGLAPKLSSEALEHAKPTASEIKAGRLRFLNQSWPAPVRPDWWNGAVWFLDPVSGLNWPGAEVSAFDAAYRHDHRRGDVKFVWEINRLQFLPALARTGADGLTLAFEVLKGWMDANPPYRGVNWTGGIEAASRMVSVLAMIAHPSRALTGAEDRRLRAFIEAHAYWIDRYPSLYSSANNHRVAELASLFLAGAAAPGMPRAARYRRKGKAGLEREILRQFHRDGVGAEQSPSYAAYSLEWFVLAGRAADADGEPMSGVYKARALAAATHLVALLDAAGHTPRIGDDDDGRVLSLDLAPDPAYPEAVAGLACAWLHRARQRAPTGVQTFAHGGYTVSRLATGEGEALLVFDHAPLGFLSIAAHGHADALSVWLHWGEEPVIVDAGAYLYHAGHADRDAFRGTAAHNTLCLEGRDQSQIAGPFNWSVHARTRLLETSPLRVVAEHSAYQTRYGLVHRRAVTFLPEGYVIEDWLLGASRQKQTAWRIGFLLHPGVQADVDGGAAGLVTQVGRRIGLTAASGAAWAIEPGWYSAGFNQRVRTRRLVLRGEHTRGQDLLVSRIAVTLATTATN